MYYLKHFLKRKTCFHLYLFLNDFEEFVSLCHKIFLYLKQSGKGVVRCILRF